MLRALFAIMLISLADPPETPESPSLAPATQPAGQGARPRSTLRKPKDFELLEPLLEREPIRPERADVPGRDAGAAGDRPSPALLPEGRMIIEKRGRYVVRDGRPMFEFSLPDSETGLVMFELQKNQLLEMMEGAVQAGALEFTITAEVQRYRNENLLNLRKLLRHVDNGNLRP